MGMMKKATAEIMLNYIIINYESATYLGDTNKAHLGYISPMFNWIFPHKAIKVPNGMFDELQKELNNSSQNVKSKSTLICGIGVLGATIGPRLLHPITDRLYTNSTMFTNILMILFTIVFTMILVMRMKQNAKKRGERYFEDKIFESYQVRILPIGVKKIITPIILHTGVFALIVLTIWLYFDIMNVIVLILVFATLFAFLVFNPVIVVPGECKFKVVSDKKE